MDVNGINGFNYFDYYSLNFNRNIEFNDNNQLTISTQKDELKFNLSEFEDASQFFAKANHLKQSYTFDIASTGYEGKEISKMTPKEAQELISEEGFFGINQTSERVANFVLDGAGDDLDKLQSGRAGVIKGFYEAQEIWGGDLPEISQKTFEATLQMIDDKIKALGGNIIDEFA